MEQHLSGAEPDTLPDNERPTDPSPPPSAPSSWPPQDSLAPAPLDSGAVALAPAAGTVAAEEHGAPKSAGSWIIGPDGHAILGPRVAKRDWLDFGKDTGPRLRVREVADTNDLIPLVEPEPTHDPRDIDELHAKSVAAFRDGDDHALGKIYEDLLDDIHASDAGEGALLAQLVRASEELQAAITAELREVSRSEKNWGWKHSLSEYGIRVRARTPQGEVFECQVDRKGTRALVMQAVSDPRGAASEVVRNAREEIHQARARVMVGGFVPVQNEVGQA